MASRDIKDLRPDVMEKAENLLTECQHQQLDILIYRTLSSLEEQARLFCRGRTSAEIEAVAARLEREYNRPDVSAVLLNVEPQNGARVTNAAPGMSLHNYGLALDAVPLRDGKPVWGAKEEEDIAIWHRYGQAAEKVGFEWGGRWTRFRDMPHIQEPGVRWQELIRDYEFV